MPSPRRESEGAATQAPQPPPEVYPYMPLHPQFSASVLFPVWNNRTPTLEIIPPGELLRSCVDVRARSRIPVITYLCVTITSAFLMEIEEL